MEIRTEEKLKELPLSKSNPETLAGLFGNQEVMPLWVADSEFQLAAPIQEALMKRVSGSGFGYEYKPQSFFEVQRHWYRQRYDLELKQEQLLFSPSIGTSMALLIELYSQPGDGVIIQPPVFMHFKEVVLKTGRKVVKNPLALNKGRYEMDFDQLEQLAAEDSNKILILCNPHNPVGRVWTKKELTKLISIAARHGLLLISDEIHKDIVLHHHQFHSIVQFVEEYDHVISLTSEAKTFNLVSISDSMAIVPHQDIQKALAKRLKYYNLGRTNALVRVALEAAYREAHPWLQALIKTIEKNVSIVENGVKDTAIGLIKPEGTYQVWLDFRKLFDDSKQMFEVVTTRSGIGMNAGHWFGREGARFMRMNIGAAPEKVDRAIKSMVAGINNQKPMLVYHYESQNLSP